ncbi:S-adenosyl-L-methionine-dependent methyltransferase [Cladochytrium replicatum]|nr:S-adenosyl-L-methionine-dependent methyltransferase [Cladochytrium replicatum]
MSEVSIRSAELLARMAKPATPIPYILNLLQPGLYILIILLTGVPLAVREQFRKWSLRSWVNIFHWRQLIFGQGFGVLLGVAAQQNLGVKRSLLGRAHGRVLEIGAGSGENVKFYNPDKIGQLYCLEPFDELRSKLLTALSKAKLDSKATVIAAGLSHDHTALESAAIHESSLDTIVLVQVLCSIPDPKSHLSYLQKLLKPGGQILLYEHVGSDDRFTRSLQRFWNPLWKRCAGGCEIVRDSADWFRDIGGWKSVDIQYPSAENSADLFPHAVARFVKA